MTDKEIIKDLEEVIYFGDYFVAPSKINLMKEVLSLINRQRIEIEGLKRDYAILVKRLTMYYKQSANKRGKIK